MVNKYDISEWGIVELDYSSIHYKWDVGGPEKTEAMNLRLISVESQFQFTLMFWVEQVKAIFAPGCPAKVIFHNVDSILGD